jgi:hypothetical protein
MNGFPDINPLRIKPGAKDFSYSRPESCARLIVIRDLLVCALSVVVTYQGKANPTSGTATVADTVLKTNRARPQVCLEKGSHKNIGARVGKKLAGDKAIQRSLCAEHQVCDVIPF